MNIKLAVPIFTIFFGLVIGNGSLHSARAQSFDKTPTAVNGKQRLNKIVDNGFQIRYKVGEKTITAFVKGKKVSNLRIGKVKLDKQSAVVIAVTNDWKLEITTYFTLDEQKQKLLIDRRIRNLSADTVDVQMMGQYVDLKLFKIQGHHAKSDLEKAALERIRGGQLVYATTVLKLPEHLRAGWWRECHCDPPPPPCMVIICKPGEMYIQGRLDSLSRDRMVFWWEEPTTLTPLTSRADVSSVTSEMHFIMEVDYGRQPLKL